MWHPSRAELEPFGLWVTADVADRVRRQLDGYGYRCFFDLDPESGLGVGEFQGQLEASLTGVPFLLAILTPAPSGPDEIRSALSYTETVRRYAQEGWTDYCHVELSKALVRQILQSSRDTHLLSRLSLPLLLCGDIVVLLLDLRLTRQRR